MQQEIKELNGSIYNGKELFLDKETQEFRSMIIRAEEDLIYALILIERFFSYSNKHFTNQKNERIRKMILDKKEDYGYIPKSTTINADKIIVNNEMKKIFYEMLKLELTERQFECIVLHYKDNMTQEEIAEKLGINQSNVSNYISNALTKIRNNKNYLMYYRQ